MREDTVTMSHKEITRLEVMQKLSSKQIKQNKAAQLLKISTRQVRRIYKEYKRQGALGVVSKRRGKPSNNKFPEEFKEQVLRIISENYSDFGPTLLCEKLAENHELNVSRESVRQWMIEEGIWLGKKRKNTAIHQMRERRSCFGELIQIDGSEHAWFEDRGEKCSLMVCIDDATSEIVSLHFEQTETTIAYFKALRIHIEKYGRPLAYYSDKHAIFRVNNPEAPDDSQTQLQRALRNLDIELICANTPQAKGRVERANKTLQDRLVKELRLRKINDIEAANKYLPEFTGSYNNKFAVVPKSKTDCHRKSIPSSSELDFILGLQYERKLSKNLELNYDNMVYQITAEQKGNTLKHAKVNVCVKVNGQIIVSHNNANLSYKTYKKQPRKTEIVNSKNLNNKIDSIKNSKEKKQIQSTLIKSNNQINFHNQARL